MTSIGFLSQNLYGVELKLNAPWDITRQTSMPDTPTNIEIRRWYIEQAQQIPVLDKEWATQGVPLVERARRAWQRRREICQAARAEMPDSRQVELVRQRNIKKYGDPEGPSFERLCEQYAERGFAENDVYKEIILSASRTNELVNSWFGL